MENMLLKNLTRVTAAAGAKQCAISTTIQSNRYMTVNRRLRYKQRFFTTIGNCPLGCLYQLCKVWYALNNGMQLHSGLRMSDCVHAQKTHQNIKKVLSISSELIFILINDSLNGNFVSN